MPESWVQSGNSFRRETYIDDTAHVPLNVLEAERLLKEFKDNLRELRVELLLRCGDSAHAIHGAGDCGQRFVFVMLPATTDTNPRQ